MCCGFSAHRRGPIAVCIARNDENHIPNLPKSSNHVLHVALTSIHKGNVVTSEIVELPRADPLDIHKVTKAAPIINLNP